MHRRSRRVRAVESAPIDAGGVGLRDRVQAAATIRVYAAHAGSAHDFESSIPQVEPVGKHTAAPQRTASAPRPASSAPATRVILARQRKL